MPNKNHIQHLLLVPPEPFSHAAADPSKERDFPQRSWIQTQQRRFVTDRRDVEDQRPLITETRFVSLPELCKARLRMLHTWKGEH